MFKRKKTVLKKKKILLKNLFFFIFTEKKSIFFTEKIFLKGKLQGFKRKFLQMKQFSTDAKIDRFFLSI